jgi:hypothetical protein
MEGMEGPTVGTEPSTHGTPVSRFSCKTHADLSSRLTEECPHSLTEWAPTGSFECRGPITLLVVAAVLSIYTQF